ncbi:hypothetical protein JTE90_011800 [Oedothorax gibbosus]|uniref:Uncharacterized protein n=1 Tax=Oedothorax gibbosus TaxID=931172 RepID=A0AAV6VRM3_9ARAC|nr:hypothetical protein JTE90_011800 [Oedothorax gibbosus]
MPLGPTAQIIFQFGLSHQVKMARCILLSKVAQSDQTSTTSELHDIFPITDDLIYQNVLGVIIKKLVIRTIGLG